MPPFSMSGNDRVRLRHMLEAANEALSFIEGKARADLDQDRMLLMALAREIEIIGEAATKVSAECKGAMPGVPWPVVSGIRNRLIHAYFAVDTEIIWSTVTSDLPGLIQELKRVLSDEE